MKIKDTFISHNSDDEHILVDASGNNFSGLIRSNVTAAFIIDRLMEGTTVEDLQKSMLEAFNGATEKDVKEDIAMVVGKLQKIGALED